MYKKNICCTTYALEKYPSFDIIIVKNQFFILKVSVVVGWFLVLRCIMYPVAVYIHSVLIFLDIAGATKGRHKKVLITTKGDIIRYDRLSVACRVLVKCISILKIEFVSSKLFLMNVKIVFLVFFEILKLTKVNSALTC